MSEYLFDTNVFMSPIKQKYYHHQTHPAFWQMTEEMMNVAKVSSIQEVFDEIKGNNWLANWVKGHKGFFKQLDGADQQRVADILQVATDWMKLNSFSVHDLTEFSSGADSYLIARALEKNMTIVSYESAYSRHSRHPESHKIKIPDIAKQVGVTCINLHDFFIAENVKFTGYSTA